MTEILRRHAFSVASIGLFLTFVFIYTSDDNDAVRFSGYTMGTTYEVQVLEVESEALREEIRRHVFELLGRLDKEVFSTYAPESELSRFNRHPPGEPFPASAELITVLQLAREISELSAGAFDVTIGPLVNIWGFGPDMVPDGFVPGRESIEAARQQVGYEYLEIDARQGVLSKSRDIYVDLSAIAKGYAVDRVGDYLASLGLLNYFIEVGGELKMSGLKPGGVSWIPAIESPEANETRIYDIFFSHGLTLAVAGSGDYRNYFEVDGVRYSHEVDPRTGRPISHNLAAVYVIDQSAARADALATAFMIMGYDASLRLAQSLRLGAYFITKSADDGFEDFYTREFAKYLSEQQ